jgi:hypothetical protein
MRFPHLQRVFKSTERRIFKYEMSSAQNPSLSTVKLELRTAYGPVFRDVLNTPPRDCTPEEIPVIDLSHLYSDKIEDRKSLAKDIRAAAVNTGFFYIKNHGIEEEKIANAKNNYWRTCNIHVTCEVAKRGDRFFKQPESEKMKIHRSKSKYFNGWKGAGQTNISPSESIDINESVCHKSKNRGHARLTNILRWHGDMSHSMTLTQRIPTLFLKK